MSKIEKHLIEERNRIYAKIRDIWLLDCSYANPQSVSPQFSLAGLAFMDGYFKPENTNAHFYIGYIYVLINTIDEIERQEKLNDKNA